MTRFIKLLSFMVAATLTVLMLTVSQARSEGSIEIKSFSLDAVDEGYQTSLDAQIVLNSTLEQALEKGIVLYFVTKFAIIDSRWFWLDEEVARSKLRIGLSYHALTRQYRLSGRMITSQSFDTLQDALHALGKQHNIPLEVRPSLKQDAEYMATLQIWLDISRLAKPFQLEWFSSKDWNLSSEKQEWRIRMPVASSQSLLK
ncbi:DUF4390 domain-containing protein [Nitrosomonas sp.]|uniref:DUF4390 domain-containing protein n=1 Tax=Nitrosomonas sp. TaxID=42353 RepID=UPI002609B460|nr:DUF4390 domain-containing protein [Nitrosomonas sp.]MCW5600329.1 DUF4390 domain-containing protein [Nitrosomonas sp.]